MESKEMFRHCARLLIGTKNEKKPEAELNI